MVGSIKRILIVDDEVAFAKILERHLKRKGFSSDLAYDGEEARQKIQVSCRCGIPFDLVITDLVMPKMNGIELLQWIKKTNPELSVLLITGCKDNAMVLEAIRANMDDYGHKPLTPQQLMKMIECIDRKRRRLYFTISKKGLDENKQPYGK
jgi:DNA-binding response OmpR family regulator